MHQHSKVQCTYNIYMSSHSNIKNSFSDGEVVQEGKGQCIGAHSNHTQFDPSLDLSFQGIPLTQMGGLPRKDCLMRLREHTRAPMHASNLEKGWTGRSPPRPAILQALPTDFGISSAPSEEMEVKMWNAHLRSAFSRNEEHAGLSSSRKTRTFCCIHSKEHSFKRNNSLCSAVLPGNLSCFRFCALLFQPELNTTKNRTSFFFLFRKNTKVYHSSSGFVTYLTTSYQTIWAELAAGLHRCWLIHTTVLSP